MSKCWRGALYSLLNFKKYEERLEQYQDAERNTVVRQCRQQNGATLLGVLFSSHCDMQGDINPDSL